MSRHHARRASEISVSNKTPSPSDTTFNTAVNNLPAAVFGTITMPTVVTIPDVRYRASTRDNPSVIMYTVVPMDSRESTINVDTETSPPMSQYDPGVCIEDGFDSDSSSVGLEVDAEAKNNDAISSAGEYFRCLRGNAPLPLPSDRLVPS